MRHYVKLASEKTSDVVHHHTISILMAFSRSTWLFSCRQFLSSFTCSGREPLGVSCVTLCGSYAVPVTQLLAQRPTRGSHSLVSFFLIYHRNPQRKEHCCWLYLGFPMPVAYLIASHVYEHVYIVGI